MPEEDRATSAVPVDTRLPAALGERDQGHTYLICAEGSRLVKIAYSTEPEKRLARLQAGQPTTLSLPWGGPRGGSRCRRLAAAGGGGVAEAGPGRGQRGLGATVGPFGDAVPFDAGGVAHAGLGCGDADRAGLERFPVAESHVLPPAPDVPVRPKWSVLSTRVTVRKVFGEGVTAGQREEGASEDAPSSEPDH